MAARRPQIPNYLRDCSDLILTYKYSLKDVFSERFGSGYTLVGLKKTKTVFGPAIEAEFDKINGRTPDPSNRISVFLAESYFNRGLEGEAITCFMNRDEDELCLVYKNDKDGYKIEYY